MANEKVWTSEQLNAAAESLTMRQELSCGVQFQKIGGYRYETWAIDLQCELTAKESELAEGVELLRQSTEGFESGMLVKRLDFIQKRNEFLQRHTGGSDGR